MRYALVNASDVIDRFSEAVDPNVQTKTGWRWLEAPRVQRPEYDQTTHVCEGPHYSVALGRVTESYVVRAKSADELKADAKRALHGMAADAGLAVDFVIRAFDALVESRQTKPLLTAGEAQAIKAMVPDDVRQAVAQRNAMRDKMR